MLLRFGAALRLRHVQTSHALNCHLRYLFLSRGRGLLARAKSNVRAMCVEQRRARRSRVLALVVWEATFRSMAIVIVARSRVAELDTRRLLRVAASANDPRDR